jgi:hypothetical protein
MRARLINNLPWLGKNIDVEIGRREDDIADFRSYAAVSAFDPD